MPRFSETEKENIRSRLQAEGERLFAAHGLKKVTIDDLIGAVHIAKASFYTFYESKECLYMDIVQGIQRKIFHELEALLAQNAELPSRERVRQVFSAMSEHMMRYPILARIDQETTELITRKVPKERLAAFSQQSIDAAQALHRHGVRFVCDVKIASLVFQALYHCWLGLQVESLEDQTTAIDLMLHGVVNEIVCE